jgi:hypothetical protein
VLASQGLKRRNLQCLASAKPLLLVVVVRHEEVLIRAAPIATPADLLE